jgi:hypothetical protein
MCGANSALINAFPVNGLRPDGECSPEQIQLVPGSLDGACAGATLDMQGDKLIGRALDGSLKCEGIALKGTTFEVRSHDGHERIEITDVTEYTAPNNEKHAAYHMEWVKNGTRHGLCSKDGQKLRKELNVPAMKGWEDLPAPTADLVIVVNSELYDKFGKFVPVDPSWKVQKPEWMNLACVDDGLAKREVFHLHTADVTRSRAALRMWTADYCGALPATMRGELIAWENTAGLETEAQWTENGASCLPAPRILRENGVPTVPTHLTQRLKDLCNNCKTLPEWMKALTTCRKEDGTVDRVIPVKCPACPVGTNCPLESKNVTQP